MALHLTVLLAILNNIGLKGSKVLVALYAIDLGASPLAIGALVSTYAIFPLVLAVYAGRVSDRFGPRSPMMLGSFGVAAGLILPVVAPSLATLYVACALIGMSSLFFQVSVHNLVGSLGEAHERTANFGTFSLGASISGFVAPVLVGFAVDHSGHLSAYAALALVSVLPGVVLAGGARFIPKRVRSEHEKQPGGVRELIANPALRRTFITGGLIITGIDLFGFYLPIYGRSIGLSASTIGMVLGMQAVAAFVVRLWMPRLAMRFGERRLLAASLLVAGVTYLSFPMVHNAFVLGLMSFVLGLGLGSGQPLSIILTYNDSPPGRAGEALGLRLAVNKLTQIAVPLVFGSLGTAAGVFPVFWANAVLLMVGGWMSRGRKPGTDPV
jgi:MFS family permease